MGSEVWAYDLDGVLCEPVPEPAKSWMRMNGRERQRRLDFVEHFYAITKLLFRPLQPRIFVITARKQTPTIKLITEQWLMQHFGPQVEQLFMFTGSRTIANVVAYKAEVLRQIGATDYAEDNRNVVRELRRQGLVTRVWHYKKGTMVLT